MVLAISGFGGRDYEEYRIAQQLIVLGIEPSGNKAIDKARLAQEKDKLINKIAERKVQETQYQHKTAETHKVTENEKSEKTEFQNVLEKTEHNYHTREELEEQKLGQKTIGELNRIFFGL